MSDLIAAAATIQGAQIQANYALLSAIIGAFGIGFAAWLAWQSGMKLHKHNNILEAKRQVYLDVVGSGSLYFSYLKRFPRINERFFDDYSKYSDDFLSKLNAILVVCDVKNKEATKALIKEFVSISEIADGNLFHYMTLFNKTKKDEVEIERKNELKDTLISDSKLMTNEYESKSFIYQNNVYELSSIESGRMKAEISKLYDKSQRLKESGNNISSQLQSLISIHNNEQKLMYEIRKTMKDIIENRLAELEVNFDKLAESLKRELL